MRYILLICLVLGLWCCQNDDDVFGVSISRENISFTPIAGGAVMHYKIPDDKDVLYIRVRYQDALGQEMIRTGSYACDSLVLVGFNEAQQNVPAYVTLCDRNKIESAPMEVSFDTKDSGPVAFFNQLEVKPSWNGFVVTYETPTQVDGMAHVLYIGEDPLHNGMDTLLLSSFQIKGGADTLTFSLENPKETTDVVIRTEDFRGYMVHEEIYEGVEAYTTMKFESANIKLEDPEELMANDPDYCVGPKYLFDGNTKGVALAEMDEIYVCIAGPNVIGKDLCILDFGKSIMLANVRLYAMLYMQRSLPGYGDKYYSVFRGGDYWGDALPCSVTVYASNDKVNWEKIGSVEDDPEIDEESRWCNRAYGINYNYHLATPTELEEAEPCYLEVLFPATGKSYRYMKLVIDELYKLTYAYAGDNVEQYMVLQELEVYTSKD